jgi:hypothetical protein
MTNCGTRGLISCFFLALFCHGDSSTAPANGIQARTPSRPIPFAQVRLNGELGARYMAATCNLLTRMDRYTVGSFAANAAGKPSCLWPERTPVE